VVQATETADRPTEPTDGPQGLKQFFKITLKAVQQRSSMGVTAPADSTLRAAQVLRDHVQGIAQVARILTTIYNMLLVP
jgi:hypothetical protein